MSDIEVKRKNMGFFWGMRERHFWKKIPNSIWGVSKRHFWKKIHSTYFRPKIVNLKNIRFSGNEPASFLEKNSKLNLGNEPASFLEKNPIEKNPSLA